MRSNCFPTIDDSFLKLRDKNEYFFFCLIRRQDKESPPLKLRPEPITWRLTKEETQVFECQMRFHHHVTKDTRGDRQQCDLIENSVRWSEQHHDNRWSIKSKEEKRWRFLVNHLFYFFQLWFGSRGTEKQIRNERKFLFFSQRNGGRKENNEEKETRKKKQVARLAELLLGLRVQHR